MTFRDPLAVLRLAKFEIGKRVGDNVMVGCPFHAGDVVPSCSVELEKRVFRCHGCGAHGPFVELLAQKALGETSRAACTGIEKIYSEFLEEVGSPDPMDPGRIEVWHKRLMAEGPEAALLVAQMAEVKGLTRKTLERFEVGWDGERYTLPVRDTHRDVVNVRHRTLEKGAKQKCKNEPKRGSPARLYPIEVLEDERDPAWSKGDWIWITEGELKALLLCQLGFRALTGTGGAKTWDPEWNVHFKDRRVAICYDVDVEGTRGAILVAHSLLKIAKEVRVVRMPMDPDRHPKGDVNDYVLHYSATAEDFEKLLDAAPVYVFEVQQTDLGPTVDLPLTPLQSLVEVNDPNHHDHHVQVDAVVAAEEPELYRVPTAWKVNCNEDQRCCPECPVHQLGKHEWKPEPWCRTDILRGLDVPEQIMQYELKKRTGIPRICLSVTCQPTEHVNIQAVELIPDLDQKSKDRDSTVPAYYAFGGESNDRRELHGSLHTIKGFPTSDPKSGRLVMLVYDVEPAAESLDRFAVGPVAKSLEVFQPAEWTASGIELKLEEVYADLAANVTHVYGRRDLHLLYDLAYHSLLEIPYNHKVQRGWVEVAAIGDAGQGKSLCFEALRNHYGLGDMAVGASCTSAGLLGSVQETRGKKRWSYRWGKIPLNDRRLVCIEEAGGLPLEIIQKLRDARSSGRHEDTKAKLTRVSTRTRLVWIANPRFNKSLCEMQYGVTAVRELLGDDPDIRRLDAAMMVARGEVELSAMRNGKSRLVHNCDAEVSRNLVTWAWSRAVDQIQFEPGAELACREYGDKLSGKYSGRLPLVLDTEQDEKLARLAAALAARTFSHVDGDPETVLIRRAHVEVVTAFLQRSYDSPSCAYDSYSKRVQEEELVVDDPEVHKLLAEILSAESAAEFLLEVPSFTSRDFAAVATIELPKAEKILGELLRRKAVRPNNKMMNSYTKTVGFTTLLKRLTSDRALKNETIEQRYAKENF